jgi:hypothetical protein
MAVLLAVWLRIKSGHVKRNLWGSPQQQGSLYSV